MKESKGLQEKELDQIFQRMDDILMDRYPLIVRRMDYERIKKESNELPSTYIERVFSSSHQAQLTHAPMVARVLVKIITSLGTDNLNKSVKDYLIRIMREDPNIDKKDHIMTHIYMPWRVTLLLQPLLRRERGSIRWMRSSNLRSVTRNIRREGVDTSANTVVCLVLTKKKIVGRHSLT